MCSVVTDSAPANGSRGAGPRDCNSHARQLCLAEFPWTELNKLLIFITSFLSLTRHAANFNMVASVTTEVGLELTC